MIVVADSGSTKCDWLILNDNYEIINHLQTIGYNPYFHNEHFIARDLQFNSFFKERGGEIKKVFFYGAGCSSDSLRNIIFKALSQVFCTAKIKVEHDLMASALACYKRQPVICCILGTGSNSCFFDGVQIHEGNPPLGYIVGDEASGSYFGKQLLNAYFNGRLPADLHDYFEEMYGLTHAEFTAKVYASDRANVYLASFMNFFSAKKEHPFIQNIIKNGFRDFIEKHICCFENYQKVKISFVGSIAFFFQEEMESLAEEYDLAFEDFIQKPIFPLVDFLRETQEVKIK